MAQPTDMVVFDNSHRPSTERSQIRKWADTLTLGHVTPMLRSAERHLGIGPVASFLHSVRASGEAGFTGLALGALSGAGMLEVDKVPLDLVGSGIAAAGAAALSHSELGTTLRTVGATSFGIFTFRKTEEWLGVRKSASVHGEFAGETTHSDVGEDPVVAAFKAL